MDNHSSETLSNLDEITDNLFKMLVEVGKHVV